MLAVPPKSIILPWTHQYLKGDYQQNGLKSSQLAVNFGSKKAY